MYCLQNLYVDCVHLVNDMLQEVTDLMTEKEIRLRVPVEELELLMTASRSADLTAGGDLSVGAE
jgi:hypothetical protein